MADNPRIEELRRRVLADPASIAFAALAEEYRRGGQYDEAIETCRTGLQRHPSYISARVTLGRALIETGDYDGAQTELESVLKVAPENLAAIRAMAEIHERLGHVAEAAAHAQPAASDPVAKGAPIALSSAAAAEAAQPTQGTVLEWQPRAPNPEPAAVGSRPPSSQSDFGGSAVARRDSPGRAEAETRTPDSDSDPDTRQAIERLEAFLASIVAARASLA